MGRHPNKPRLAGGATLTVVIVVLLLAAAYFGYRGLVFYRESVAPAVEQVAKVATAVKGVIPTLNPYKLTRDPDEIARMLGSVLRIAPPEGYVGAFGFAVEFLGQKHMELVALIPAGVPPEQIFEGGRNVIRFNPGRHTIFLAARQERAERDEMRDAIAAMTGGETQAARLEPVAIAAGGKRVAAYRGVVESYGTRNRVVMVFLDEGRILHAAGPADAFDERALERTLAALVAVHPANDLLYEHPKAEAITAPRDDPCGIRGLAGDFDVVVVSVERGSTPLAVALDQSGRDAAREEVVVGVTPKPVVLVLTGNDPIVWNVGRAPGARIAGVLAQGVHRQAVIGLPRTTPMSTYSTADGPNACKHFRTAGKAESREYRAVERRVRELFGRGIGTFLDRKAGGRFVVGNAGDEVSYSPDVTLKHVALPDTVLLPGQRGIDRLVKESAIRPATDEDVDAWVRGAAQRLGQPVDAYRRKMNWRLDRDSVYVVLRDFDLPGGLAGSNARTFIIPAGKPRPAGPKDHCTFLTMEGFQCYGTGCG